MASQSLNGNQSQPASHHENEIDLDDPYDGDNSLWDQYLNSPLTGGELFEGFEPVDNEAASPPPTQTEIHVQNTRVLFPQTPYPSQVEMMDALISSLNLESNSLIESPTGSGKTLALLCGVLAWRSEKFARDRATPPKIFYCTKTHAQVSNVMSELRKTDYVHSTVPPLKVAVLGSRTQMCVNQEVVSEARANGMTVEDLCDKLKRNFIQGKMPRCSFYKRPEEDCFSQTRNGASGVLDIEDLQNLGRSKGCCPYFGTRRQLAAADFVICPYNYIISATIRQSLRISLKNAVLIFDEGHNLEKALCTEGSMSLGKNLFGDVFTKCRELSLDETVSPEVKVASERLFKAFHCVFEWMRKSEVESFSPEEDKNEGDSVDLEQLKALEGFQNLSQVKSGLSFVTDPRNAGNGPVLDRTTSQTIQKVVTVLEYAFNTEDTNYFVNLEKSGRHNRLNVICTNPGIVFQEIAKETRSIAITSGTLTPIGTFAEELSINFMEPLCLDQSIPRERYMVSIVSVGPEGNIPRLTLCNRSKAASHLGETIIQICEKVPNGVIVFFPSKEFLGIMMEDWKYCYSSTQGRTLLERLKDVKHVINEVDMTTPQKSRELLQKYRDLSKEGALLLGVHRGKVSEGVDFRDHEARAVINIGIPYAPSKAPEVSARRRDQFGEGDNQFWDWYTTDAFRAVNQGLGRSVRHRRDWGAIIMIDPRFHDENRKQFISKWIRDAAVEHSPIQGGFDEMISELTSFVNRMQNE